MKVACGLSHKSIANAISQLEEYKVTLAEKCKEFTQNLIDRGINVAMFTLRRGYGDAPRDADFGVKIDESGNLVTGLMSIKGEGILFWEFGAGNYYNGMTSLHPKAGQLGMGPGTYPGQTHVPNPGVWVYVDDSGNKHFSRGTQATMPMFKASIEMAESVWDVAREVFGV